MKNNISQGLNFGVNTAMKLMGARMGNLDFPKYYKDTVSRANEMATSLYFHGGFPQQERMIRDKKRSLDKATLYSYQGAWVKKIQSIKNLDNDDIHPQPARALINPDKNKFDYDDKIISIGFEHGFEVGDVFEWCNTNSQWLITLQDLDEIAYFRAEIRRCDYQINWLDENGNEQRTYAAIRGPVETKINFIQKHGISIDEPNHTLHILLPKNEQTIRQFQRYKKFYLKDADTPDNKICWRVEATDSISTKGIFEITAVEYYANETEDNISEGLIGAYIKRNIEPEINPEKDIIGPTFIKPKITYEYFVDMPGDKLGDWYINSNSTIPIILEKFRTERDGPGIRLKWNASYSGQFTLLYGKKDSGHYKNFSKTIVVESLF